MGKEDFSNLVIYFRVKIILYRSFIFFQFYSSMSIKTIGTAGTPRPWRTTLYNSAS